MNTCAPREEKCDDIREDNNEKPIYRCLRDMLNDKDYKKVGNFSEINISPSANISESYKPSELFNNNTFHPLSVNMNHLSTHSWFVLMM